MTSDCHGRARTVLASNINHSVYLAAALAESGRLAAFHGPNVFGQPLNLCGLAARSSAIGKLNATRVFPEMTAIRNHRLAMDELVRGATARIGRPVPCAIDDLLLGAGPSLSLLARRNEARYFHFHSTHMAIPLAIARRNGYLTICDHRALHPSDEPDMTGNGRLCRELAAEFEAADEVVVNSLLAKDSLIRHGIPAEKTHVIPLGVDVDFFQPPMLSHRNNPLSILFVGQVGSRKAINVLLDAVDGSGWTLTVAGGPGPGFPSARLREQDGVTYVGPQDREQLRLRYQQADVLVLPSASEAFGLVAAEAMACGTPAIVSSGCGAKMLIRPGENGMVFNSGSAVDLARALRVLDHPGRRLPMRAAARETAESYSWERYKRNVQLFYEGLDAARGNYSPSQ